MRKLATRSLRIIFRIVAIIITTVVTALLATVPGAIPATAVLLLLTMLGIEVIALLLEFYRLQTLATKVRKAKRQLMTWFLVKADPLITKINDNPHGQKIIQKLNILADTIWKKSKKIRVYISKYALALIIQIEVRNTPIEKATFKSPDIHRGDFSFCQK